MSLGERNDFARAKAEFDTALRLAQMSPRSSTFGEPERGAIRLNPIYPMCSARPFAYIYFT